MRPNLHSLAQAPQNICDSTLRASHNYRPARISSTNPVNIDITKAGAALARLVKLPSSTSGRGRPRRGSKSPAFLRQRLLDLCDCPGIGHYPGALDAVEVCGLHPGQAG